MLRSRILTALVGAPVFLFFVYLGGYWYGLIIVIISLIALKEYYSLVQKGGWNPLKVSGYLFVPLALLTVFKENLALTLAIWVLFFAVSALFPVFLRQRMLYWESAISYWGIIYTGGFASFLLAIRLLPEGFFLSLLLILIIWFTDVSAYLIGSFLGKTPLAPRISPKKTVEGTLAGLAGSSIAGFIFSWLFHLANINVLTGAFLGLMVGLTGTLGDLSQSSLKRSVDAKDSGDFLPGHGGILDRFDSLLFAAPFFYMYVRHFLFF